MEIGVFSNQDDFDGLEEAILLSGEPLPLCPCSLATVHQCLRFLDAVEIKYVSNYCDQTLILQQQRDVVG